MDDTGQQKQTNDEIDSLLFRTGMYIDELKILSNVEGFKPEDNIFDQDGNINNEGKQIIMSVKNDDLDTSYKRFLLKLKVCLIELGKFNNLKNNIESNNLSVYLQTLNNVLRDVNSEEEQQKTEEIIKMCTKEKSLQQCQEDLVESRNKLDKFRKKVEEALKTSKDEIIGFTNAADVLNKLKEEINEQINEINNKGDKITDDEINEFVNKIKEFDGQEGDIQELIAEDIQTVTDKLQDLKDKLNDNREKKENKEKLEKEGKELEGKAAALSAEILKANTEPVNVGAEESETDQGDAKIEDSVIEPTVNDKEGADVVSVNTEEGADVVSVNTKEGADAVSVNTEEGADVVSVNTDGGNTGEVDMQTLAKSITVTPGTDNKNKIPAGPSNNSSPPELPEPLSDEQVNEFSGAEKNDSAGENYGDRRLSIEADDAEIGDALEKLDTNTKVSTSEPDRLTDDADKTADQFIKNVESGAYMKEGEDYSKAPPIPTSGKVNLTSDEIKAKAEEGEKTIDTIGLSTGSKTEGKRRIKQTLLPADNKKNETRDPNRDPNAGTYEIVGGRKRKQSKKKKKSRRKSNKKNNKKSRRKSKKKRN